MTASDAGPGTEITHTLLTAGKKAANQKVYTTAAIAPAPNTLITVAVMGHRGNGASPSPTLSGGGMTTWTEVASVTFDPLSTPLKRVTIYRGMSPSPGSGPLTITFSATQSNCQWIVSQWGGVDLSGVNGAGAIAQTGSNRGNAVSGLTVPLAALGNANNVAYGVFGVQSSVLAVTPGAGFTEISEQPSAETPRSDLEAEWARNLNAIAATWSSRNAGALGVEIRAATVTPVPVATVEVSPAAPSVPVGQTVQLSGTLRDANGNVLSGRTVTWATSASAVATVSGTGLATGVGVGSATITATSEGVSGTATLTVTATPPGTVTDLAVAGVTDASVTLSFTEVNDGAGQPASYDIRGVPGTTLTWGSTAPSVSQGTCATPVAGNAIGAPRTCTVLGLSASTTYSFQLVAFRGTLNVNAEFGELSNVTTGTTAASAAAPVASLTVSPGSASVIAGGTQQLVATLKDANGNVLTGRGVTWTSSNATAATVSSTGLTAALVTGTATITATSEGQSGSAAITVTSAGSGPEPGPTATIIFQDGFESGSLDPWEQIPANGRYSVTTSAARVKSGSRSLQTLYTPTNGYGMITKWFMPGYDEVYVRFYVLFEEGFQNKRDDGYGMHFFVLSGNRIDDSRSSFGKAGVVPDGTNYFYAGLDPEQVHQDPTLRPFSYYTYYPDMSCCYGNIFTQPSPKTALLGGQWQEVVFHVKLNTPGQADGSQTLWINGVKKLERLNMRWRFTTDLRINQIRFDNYMPGAPQTQHIWVDDVTVWRP